MPYATNVWPREENGIPAKNTNSHGPALEPLTRPARCPQWARFGGLYVVAASLHISLTPKGALQMAPGRLPEVVPHPGLRNRIFVDQH
jgi:hypothetical protein